MEQSVAIVPNRYMMSISADERGKKMILTKKQREDFEIAARPLMEYLGKNHHPHVKVIVDNGSSEILESSSRIITDDYIAD
jgi:hypothetical protein